MIPVKLLANRATLSLISRNLSLTVASNKNNQDKCKKNKGGLTQKNPCCKAAQPGYEGDCGQRQMFKSSEPHNDSCSENQRYSERDSQNENCPPKDQCYERETQCENFPPKDQCYNERESLVNEDCLPKSPYCDEREVQNENSVPKDKCGKERRSSSHCDERRSQKENCPTQNQSAKERRSQNINCPPIPSKRRPQNEICPPKNQCSYEQYENRPKRQQCQGDGYTQSSKSHKRPSKANTGLSHCNNQADCTQTLQEIRKTVSLVACESRKTSEMLECLIRKTGPGSQGQQKVEPSKSCKCGWITTLFYILGVGFLANLAYCIYRHVEERSEEVEEEGEGESSEGGKDD